MNSAAALRTPRSLRWLCIFLALAVLQRFGVLQVDPARLGLSAAVAWGLLLVMLGTAAVPMRLPRHGSGLAAPPRVVVSVGTGIVPLSVALYASLERHLALFALLPTIAAVAFVARTSRGRVLPSGIAQLSVAAPLVAVLMAPLVLPGEQAALALAGGIIGVLVGADLLAPRGDGLQGAHARVVGTGDSLDAILLTGLFALLLS